MTRIFSRRKRPVLEAVGQIFILLAIAGAVIYGGAFYPEGILWQALAKMSAVGFLALFVGINLRTISHVMLLLALIASVVGDVMLTLPYEQAFLYGLLAFFVAHVIYIILYLANRERPHDVSSLRLRIAGLLWLFAIGSSAWMYDALGDMRYFVLAYTAVLTLMATTALLSKFPVQLVGLGALLFVASDAALGARQFLNVPDYVGYFVWVTYFLSQLFMVLGIMLTEDRPTHFGGYRFD